MRLAPTLTMLERSDWNFLGTPRGRHLIDGAYAKAETEAWRAASAELRALVRVARAAARFKDTLPYQGDREVLNRALAALDHASAPVRAGKGKR